MGESGVGLPSTFSRPSARTVAYATRLARGCRNSSRSPVCSTPALSNGASGPRGATSAGATTADGLVALPTVTVRATAATRSGDTGVPRGSCCVSGALMSKELQMTGAVCRTR